jgi:hypothetical protein
MEGSLITYQNATCLEAIEKAKRLKNEVKKYNGEFVFLWHNSAFNTTIWKSYIPLLEELYKD